MPCQYILVKTNRRDLKMAIETAKDSLILNQIIEQKRDTFMVEEDCIVLT